MTRENRTEYIENDWDNQWTLPSPKYPLTNTVSGRALHQGILERDDYICQICGEHPATNIDHVITRRYGGTHHPRNLRTVCSSCNSRKGWFDRSPFETIEAVEAVLAIINDQEDGDLLLRILRLLRKARIVKEDSIKRVDLLICSGIISGIYHAVW